MRITERSTDRRGGALLAVLWLSAALAAIAFSLATTVRGENERAATAIDGLRSQYLATGALRRAVLYMDWGRRHPEEPRFKPPGLIFPFDFPEGQARVEAIPESSKLNINSATPEDLLRLLVNLGEMPGDAQEIVAAILDWRSASPEGDSPFDAFYASMTPRYRAPHVPFAEIEELLSVKGVTPDLFYGAWVRAPEGGHQRLMPRAGLRDCVSVFGSTAQFDANTAEPAVLVAAGLPVDVVASIVQERQARPFQRRDELSQFSSAPGFGRLGLGGNSIFTLRATARLRLPNGQLSDLRRTVAAMVKFMPPGYDSSYHILRWYDSATPGS